MTNHDHGIGAEPSWKSIEKILSAIVLDFLLIYSQALCYSTHIVVVNRLSAIYYYIVVLLLLLSNTALGTTCQLIGVAGLDWAELAYPGCGYLETGRARVKGQAGWRLDSFTKVLAVTTLLFCQ